MLQGVIELLVSVKREGAHDLQQDRRMLFVQQPIFKRDLYQQMDIELSERSSRMPSSMTKPLLRFTSMKSEEIGALGSVVGEMELEKVTPNRSTVCLRRFQGGLQ